MRPLLTPILLFVAQLSFGHPTAKSTHIERTAYHVRENQWLSSCHLQLKAFKHITDANNPGNFSTAVLLAMQFGDGTPIPAEFPNPNKLRHASPGTSYSTDPFAAFPGEFDDTHAMDFGVQLNAIVFFDYNGENWLSSDSETGRSFPTPFCTEDPAFRTDFPDLHKLDPKATAIKEVNCTFAC